MKHVAAAILIACAPHFAAADEVTEVIQEALEAYEAGDLAYAKESLDYAAQLIGQQKTAGLSDLLPAPFEGWTAEDDAQAAAGMAVLGGSAAKRIYERMARGWRCSISPTARWWRRWALCSPIRNWWRVQAADCCALGGKRR